MNISDSIIRIINYMWSKQNVSIAELTEELFLEKSAVSRSLSRLRKLGIIVKTGEIGPSAQGGRRTNLFTFNYRMASILGLQIEQDGIGGVLTDLSGKSKKSFSIKEKISQGNIVPMIQSALENVETEDIAGLGIAIPGILDAKKGKVILSSAIGLREYPLLDVLKKEIDLPIIVENDSNAGVSYFKLKNKKKIKNILYFLLSIPYEISDDVGFGVGIMADGVIYHGNANLEGEYQLGRPIVYSKKMNIYKFFEIANDKDVKAEIIEFMDFLAEKLGIILSIFDPELAVIGGNISLLPKDTLDYLVDRARKEVSMWEYRDMKIVTARPREMIIAKGAASIMLHHFFTTRDGIRCFLKRYYGEKI